jgi:hypothetical protein
MGVKDQIIIFEAVLIDRKRAKRVTRIEKKRKNLLIIPGEERIIPIKMRDRKISNMME